MTGVVRWVVGGFLGGAVGVGVWVLVGYLTEYEIGWIAWGVGFLVGVGVRYAAHLDDQEESFAQGIVAAMIAIGAIVMAKYLVFSMLVDNVEREVLAAIPTHDEAMIAGIADEIAQDMMDRGQRVNWPPGMTYEEAEKKADYPPAMWRQAEARWNDLDAEGQEQRRREVREMIERVLALMRPRFADFFSGWDLLWIALATFTAYRIGVGSYGTEE